MMIVRNILQRYWKDIRLDLKFAVIFGSVLLLILLFIGLVFIKFGSYEQLQSQEKYIFQQKARLLLCLNQELEIYTDKSARNLDQRKVSAENCETYYWLHGSDYDYLQ